MAALLAPAPIIPLNERPIKNTIVLFDVDDTLTPARRVSQPMSLTAQGELVV
jgi:phosphomannomutase